MNILVSACLLGLPCRYDGESRPHTDALTLLQSHTLIPFCPECMGGLPTPRTPAEQQGALVMTRDGRDVTEQYHRGAAMALRLAQLYRCDAALLKERSPSCGHGAIYDGSFTGRLTAGDGVTAALLLQNGIAVYGESEWEKLL